MLKYSVFGFLPALLFSVSAHALSCFPNYSGSTGCDTTDTAGDCKTLGYDTEDVTGCTHYIYCPFNTDYKVCINKGDDSTTTPTCKDGGYSDTKDRLATKCTEVSYKGLTCYNCSYSIIDPGLTPSTSCADKAAQIQDLAQIGTYLAECESSRYCYNKGVGDKTYSAWYAKPMLAFLGLSDPQIFCGEANHSTRGNKCQEAKTKLTELVNAHNTNCPNNKVTAPKIDCTHCYAMGACDNSGYVEDEYCVGPLVDR